ncbi:MAG TPA: cytochrome c oxidase assembly protein [Hyphomicrobiaceae bacterium]|nr:cytochrome c oxidase assembly protein [Hyphomicrobiaceae bacterium]
MLEPNRPRSKTWIWAGGWGALILLFASPLCPLTSALFSARVAHDVLLVSLVPPLLIASLPGRLRAAIVHRKGSSCFCLCILRSCGSGMHPAPTRKRSPATASIG